MRRAQKIRINLHLSRNEAIDLIEEYYPEGIGSDEWDALIDELMSVVEDAVLCYNLSNGRLELE